MVRVGSASLVPPSYPSNALFLPSPGVSPSGRPWPTDVFELANQPGNYLSQFPNSPLPSYSNPLQLFGLNGLPPFSGAIFGLPGSTFQIPSFSFGFDPRSASFGLALPRTTYAGPMPGGGNGTIAADHLGVVNPFTSSFSHTIDNLAVRGNGYGIDGSITAGGQLAPAFFPSLIGGLLQNPNDPMRALLNAASTSRFAERDALSGFFDQNGHRVDWMHNGTLGFDGPDRIYGNQALGAAGTTGGITNLFGTGFDLPAAHFATNGAFAFDANPTRQAIAGAGRLGATLDQPLMFGGRELLPAGTQLDNYFSGFADRGPDGIALGLRNILGIENADVQGGQLDTALSGRIAQGSRPGAIDAAGNAAIDFRGVAARDLDLAKLFPGVPLAVRQGADMRGGANVAFDVRDLSRDGIGNYRVEGDAALTTGLVTTDDIRLGPNGPVLIAKGTPIDPTIAARFAATPDQLTAFLQDRIGLKTAAIDTPIGRLPGFQGDVGGEQQIELTKDRFRGAGNLFLDGRIDEALRLGPFELAPAGSRLLGDLRGAVDIDTKNGSGAANIDRASLFAGRRDETKWGYVTNGLSVDGNGKLAWDKSGIKFASGDVEAFQGIRAGTNKGGDHRGLFAEGHAGVKANVGVDYDGKNLRRAEGDLYATVGSKLGFETKNGRTSIGAEARAGASLGFSAKADKDDLNIGAKAFIGGGVGVEARHDFKGKDGEDAGHVSAKAEALVGLGFDAKVQSTKKDGKLEWKLELGAALGIGFKISLGGSIPVKD